MALSPDHNRVTVYRYHSDKVALFQAVILREIQQSASEILTALSNLSVAQNPVIEGFVLAVKSARQHPLIRRLLDTELEWLLLRMLISAVLSPGGLLGGDEENLRRAARYLLQPLLPKPE